MNASTPIQQCLRLGTRGSLLARMQSQQVASKLEWLHPGLVVELVICRTTGDRVIDRTLTDLGGKGLFTKELEEALLDGRIDCAVHSMKDVPVTMPLVDPSELVIAAVPEREDPRDVLISVGAASLGELKQGARVGIGSLRRRSQLLARRPDLIVVNLRGNIDTRLQAIRNGRCDAVVLAAAGLRRGGMYDDRLVTPIDETDVLPAAGQGALALQCRRSDLRTKRLLEAMEDRATRRCVELERALVAALDGDCHSPIGAHATTFAGQLELKAAVGARGGLPPVVHASARGRIRSANEVLGDVVEQLLRQGAGRLLHGRQSELPELIGEHEEEHEVTDVLTA